MSRFVPTPSAAGGGTRGAIIAASFGALVAQMCLTVMAPLLGLFQSDLGASAANLTWLNAAMFAPTAILELNFGVLGDLFGRRRLIIGGQAVCAVGAVVGIFADSVSALAIGMVLLGLGAAALLPSTLATIAALSRTGAERSKAIATWAMAIAIASALSPLLAGILAEKVGLHAAFSGILVLAIIGAGISFVLLPDTSSPAGRTLDWRGQLLCGVGLLAFIYAIIQGAESGWGATDVVVAYVIAAVAIVAFVVAELRHRAPMFQVRLLKNPAFRAAALTGLFGMLSFLGTVYVMVVKLGPVNHQGPIILAMPFVILQIVPICLGPWLGRLLHHVSPRTLLVIGLVLMAAGELWYAALGVDQFGLGAIAGPVLLIGVGFIFMFSSVTAAAVNSVPSEMLGMASGATSLVRETGQTLGAAVISAIAMTHASSLVATKLHGLTLPPQAAAAVNGAAKEGGPLALVNAPFPKPVAEQVVPMARAALESGFDIGVITMAALALVAAVVVAATMRGAAARPLTGLEETEAEEPLDAVA
ncbi:MAG: MFS transporter [Nocardioides sp.]|nr:MFS transporter [Nocardioides sp.]